MSQQHATFTFRQPVPRHPRISQILQLDMSPALTVSKSMAMYMHNIVFFVIVSPRPSPASFLYFSGL